MTTSDYFNFLRETRELYLKNWTGDHRQDPYKFGMFLEYATPIERNMWSDCRAWGLEMYPQFPVGKYYLDFANPFHKIAIEVDGKIHQQTKERDRKRDGDLEMAGWTIFRVDGWKTYRKHWDYFDEWNEIDEKDLERYENNSSESLVRELASKYKRVFTENDSDELVTSEDIVKQIEAGLPRRERQKLLNEYLFGYKMPHCNVSYRAV